MAHLHKKMKKGRPYYYIRESKRINGKPTIVNQVYLGTADAILARLKAAELPLPNRFASKEFGALFVLNELDRTSINLAWLIDDTLPKRRKPAHLSMGESLYYTVLNRAIAPRSKRQLAAWYEQTDIQHIRPVNLKDLSSQAIWNQWNRLSETDLEHLSERFFEQVQTLLPKPGGHVLFDTTNFYTYLGSTTPSELAKRGYNKAGKHQLRQIGLALITERTTGVPIYYRTYRGNQHDARFFDEQLPDIVKKLTQRGLQVNDLTLIFDKGMTSEANITCLDAQDHLHFITSYSLYLAPDLARIPLKHFQPLACPHNDKLKAKGQNSDQILYLQRHETFWGQRRQVLITYNPKTFRKKRYELREKLAKVRPVLYELRCKHRESARHWRNPEAIRAHYEQLCEDLHLNPKFFDLRFYEHEGESQMVFQLNRYQTEQHLRRLAKTLLITDHQDWSASAIYQAYLERHRVEDQFRQAKSPFQVALMPQYHWTESKIRIHVWLCVVALTYLALLRQRLRQGGDSRSIASAISSLRELRTALYWLPKARKPRRQLEELTLDQVSLLRAWGFMIREGRVLHIRP